MFIIKVFKIISCTNILTKSTCDVWKLGQNKFGRLDVTIYNHFLNTRFLVQVTPKRIRSPKTQINLL